MKLSDDAGDESVSERAPFVADATGAAASVEVDIVSVRSVNILGNEYSSEAMCVDVGEMWPN